MEPGPQRSEKIVSLKSMTGCGRGSLFADGIKIEVEVSSVNRKQLDVSINLPRALSVLESRVYEEVHGALTRGRVSVEVLLHRSTRNLVQSIRIDEQLAGAYVKALRKTAKKLNLRDDLGGSLLLTLPDVLKYEQLEEETESVWPLIRKALQRALCKLMEMRVREGKELQRDLQERFGRLSRSLDHITRRAPEVTEKYRVGLMERLEKAGVVTQTDDEKLLREMAFFADRSDFTEEVTRLKSHFKQAAVLMKGNGTAGRSLDFLVQEMLREINTLGSKANDSEVSKQVVFFKTELERIREQVQNIE